MKERLFECLRDNLTIRGTEYLPEGHHLPIAIVSHGFMANQESTKRYAQFFAKLGYAAYCFDFCGGSVKDGKSDGRTTDMSVLTETKDLKAVIDYVKTLPYVNKDHIVLMGCSQGGFVSALVAKELQEKITKLVLFYPALCIPDDARKGSMQAARFDPNHIPDFFDCGAMHLGRIYVEDVIKMDPYQEISPYLGPIFLIHGDNDTIVNLSYSKEAYKAYEEVKPNRTTFEIIKDGDHGFTQEHDLIALNALKEFILK